jgi:phage terminase large subunit
LTTDKFCIIFAYYCFHSFWFYPGPLNRGFFNMKCSNVFSRILSGYLDGKTLIVNRGGSSSTKSYSTLQFLILLANKKKFLISVVSETWPHLSRGVYTDFLNILKNEGMYDEKYHNKTDHSYQFGHGKIEFFSVDAVSKVHGPRRQILFINEANNVSFDIYTQLEIRTEVCTFMDFNPTSPFWYNDLPPNENMIEIVSTYKDNPFLTEKIIRGIEAKRLVHPEWFRVYGLGEWGILAETIFTNWSQCEKIPKDSKFIGFGLDWGFTNDPTAIIEVRMQDGELFLRELCYETDLTNRDVIKKLEEVGVVRGIDDIIADSNEPKSIHELKTNGWLIRPAPKGKDSINNGIDILKQYKINITSDSVNLIREFRTYRWMTDKITGKTINKPIGGQDHGIDAIRYVASAKLNKTRKFLRQWN